MSDRLLFCKPVLAHVPLKGYGKGVACVRPSDGTPLHVSFHQ